MAFCTRGNLHQTLEDISHDQYKSEILLGQADLAKLVQLHELTWNCDSMSIKLILFAHFLPYKHDTHLVAIASGIEDNKNRLTATT